MSQTQKSEFERVANKHRGGFFSDFWYFLRANKKWWMLPLIILLFLFGGLMMLSGTALAPFIYTLF